MKKCILLALSALALASCSNDEVVVNNPANAISFRVTALKGSRAETNPNAFNGTFKVYAYAGSEAYINGVEYSVANGWGSARYFWPESLLDFYAVAPTSVSIASNKIAYTVTDGNEDLCYAVTKEAQKPASADTKTVLNFRHALSQVKFKLKNTASDIEVYVKDVKLENIGSVATLTLPSETTKADADNSFAASTVGIWSDATNAKEYTVGTLDGVTPLGSGTPTVVGSPLYLLPQLITPWDPANATNGGVRVAVKCTVKGGVNKNVTIFENKTVYIPLPSVRWLQSKIYTYTLTFGQGAGYLDDGSPALVNISLSATVDNFVNAGTIEEIKPNL